MLTPFETSLSSPRIFYTGLSPLMSGVFASIYSLALCARRSDPVALLLCFCRGGPLAFHLVCILLGRIDFESGIPLVGVNRTRVGCLCGGFS